MILIVAVVVSLFSCSVVQAGAGVTLTWEKPDDSRVTGYNIYWGLKGTDFKAIPKAQVMPETQTSVNVEPLEEGTEYGFSATSVDAIGNESAFSLTIYYTTPVTPPPEEEVTIPPVVPLPGIRMQVQGYIIMTPVE